MPTTSDSKPEHKNAIWIFGDQHRAQALSCNGDSNVDTPNLDRLSMEGQNFERAVCGFPLWLPLPRLTADSRYPHEAVPGHEYPLPEGMPTVAHVFNEHGFDTAYSAKGIWAVSRSDRGRAAMIVIPTERRGGFGYMGGLREQQQQWDTWVKAARDLTLSIIACPDTRDGCPSPIC